MPRQKYVVVLVWDAYNRKKRHILSQKVQACPWTSDSRDAVWQSFGYEILEIAQQEMIIYY